MSDLSEKVRSAIYARLATTMSSQLTYLGVNLTYGGELLQYGTGEAAAVYYGKAPNDAEYPFIEFSRIPGVVDYTFQNNRIGERDRWWIKSFTDHEGAGTESPVKKNEDILAAAETAIGNTLTLSGATAHRVTRVADIPELVELVNGRAVYMDGFQLEVYAG